MFRYNAYSHKYKPITNLILIFVVMTYINLFVTTNFTFKKQKFQNLTQ